MEISGSPWEGGIVAHIIVVIVEVHDADFLNDRYEFRFLGV